MGTISDNTLKKWHSVVIRKEKENVRPRLYTFEDMVGFCPHVRQVKSVAEKAAGTDFPILIYGESGTGKELLAQSIHSASTRAEQPFIAVNGGAIPENLVESEWFGYEHGAFTGAKREGSSGKFENAHLGTLFLDEVAELSSRSQLALLRVLQEKEITRIGGNKRKPVDVRIIAATNKNLLEEVRGERFRLDLYYRLKGIHIVLPPLRERSDIIPLAEYLLTHLGYPLARLTEEAERMLSSYDWPGNIRELNSVLMQASFLADGGEITSQHLQLEHVDVYNGAYAHSSMEATEIAAIKNALYATKWNISKAAERLQIGRNTLYRKMKAYQIRQP